MHIILKSILHGEGATCTYMYTKTWYFFNVFLHGEGCERREMQDRNQIVCMGPYILHNNVWYMYWKRRTD